MMDGKFIATISKYIDEIEIYPYINVCHYLLLSIQIRQLAPGGKSFSRQHPLASWAATMLVCFAGSILSNFLIGEPLIIPLKYYENILHASLCWYVVNYFPFDLCFTVTSFLPVYLLLFLAKELYRCRMIRIGISVGVKRYPDSVLVWLLLGLGKGCGEDIVLPLAQAFMGHLTTNELFLLRPTFNVKGSLAVALMFSLERIQKVPFASNQIFLAAFMFLTYFRISSLIVGIKDPFVPFENIICGLFFGGLVDYIKRISHKSQEDEYVVDKETSTVGPQGDANFNACPDSHCGMQQGINPEMCSSPADATSATTASVNDLSVSNDDDDEEEIEQELTDENEEVVPEDCDEIFTSNKNSKNKRRNVGSEEKVRSRRNKGK